MLPFGNFEQVAESRNINITVHRSFGNPTDLLGYINLRLDTLSDGDPFLGFVVTFGGTGRVQYLDHPVPDHGLDAWLPVIQGLTGSAGGTPSSGGGGTGPTGGGGGVGSASGGGVESRPLWLTGSHSEAPSTAEQNIRYQSLQLLTEFTPAFGPRGEIGTPASPQVVDVTNAVSAAGVDYVAPGSSHIVASIFAAETRDSVYEHDYAVCSRVQQYELGAVLPTRYNFRWWWLLRASKARTGHDELVIPLVVVIDGSTAVVDSRYLVENYPTQVSGTVLNYQIWATSTADSLYFLDSIVSSLARRYEVSFANLSAPALPTVFARRAVYRNPNIELSLENLGQARAVRFFGPLWTEPRRSSEKFVDFTFNVPAGRSEVSLPVGAAHDAVIYLSSGNFLDKVYVASGYWFAWDDSSGNGTSLAFLKTSELQHGPIPGAARWFVSPPLAELTGSVTDAISWSHVGMGYAFSQGKDPIDLSGAYAVSFWAKGDGKSYRLKLESSSVKDNDFHGVVFRSSPDWQLITIPFAQISQEGWGQPVSWDPKDIHTISFVTAGRPLNSVYLAIDRVSFLARERARFPPRARMRGRR